MVMVDLSLGILRVIVVGLIIFLLYRAGRRTVVRDVLGVRWVVAGFVLILFAAAITVAGNLFMPNEFIVYGRLGIESLLEKVFALAGFSLLAVGFRIWLPGVAGQQQTEMKLRDALDKVEQQARQRAIEIARVKDEAESVCAAKSQFLVRLSHELRNPLNGIVGFADILSDMDIGAEPRHFVRIIKSSTDNLLKIVDDVLDFSELEGGNLTFQEADFHLRDLLAGVRARFQPEAESKSLSLQWDIAEDLPDALRGDGERLVQVIGNLLENGIKFSKEGSVGFRARLENMDADGVQLHFSVCDTGVGVAASRRETLFESFIRGHHWQIRQDGDTGLGLAIASRLVRMMGGSIWFKENSEAGSGSVFQFTARFGHAEAKVEGADESGLFTSVGRRILLAEDDPVNQMLTTRILQWQGWEVTCVDDGRKVMEALAAQTFDLILMDVQMPNQDGLETTAAIRAAEKINGGHLKIIALTAHAMPGDREECMDAGMDGYVEKPFKAEELVAVIERHLA